jgi:GTP cyclohydrolase I
MSNFNDLKAIESLYRELIIQMGENPDREGLVKTPKRAAKAMQYMTKGYSENIDKIVNNAIFLSDNDEMVIVKNIEFYSLCEHHILPFFGKVHVAYIPNRKVIGLSKIPRIVDVFARRIQIQETLTVQIAECIMSILDCKGVGVVIDAKHTCMMMRGVEKQNASMTTSRMQGLFRKDERTRAEFLSLIKSNY